MAMWEVGSFLPFGRDKKWSSPGQQATVSVEGLGKPWESWLMPQQLLEKPRRPGGADLPPAFPSSPLLCPFHGVSSLEIPAQGQAPFHFLITPWPPLSSRLSPMIVRAQTHAQTGYTPQSMKHPASSKNTVAREGT